MTVTSEDLARREMITARLEALAEMARKGAIDAVAVIGLPTDESKGVVTAIHVAPTGFSRLMMMLGVMKTRMELDYIYQEKQKPPVEE